MEYQFSNRVSQLKPSAIREIFKYSADPAYIPLSAGNPAPEAFPSDAISKISADLLKDAPVSALQYSVTEGCPALRDYLSEYLQKKHHTGSSNDAILITSGAQQVMDLFTKAVVNPGDVILCEDPSFIGSLNTFRSFQARLVGVPMEDDGIDMSRLKETLSREKNIKYFYTIPNFQNPSGITMSLEKRKALYQLCSEHSIMILEDNPYGDLRFRGEDIPTIKSMDSDGIVMYCGSFSKVIAPGIRVGYAVGPAPVIQKMVVCKQGEDVHTNIWAQMICHRFMTEYDYEAHLESLRSLYSKKAALLEGLMKEHFTPKGITWRPFDGGLFAWCSLPKAADMPDYVQKALEQKVCVVPGTAFLTDEAVASDSFRINFSTPTDQQLITGIERLASIL